jgi:hypothetical protein
LTATWLGPSTSIATNTLLLLLWLLVLLGMLVVV